MIVLIYAEVAVRERDSKLLLATVAASRGHKVVVADKQTLLSAINRNLFSGAIFHTKSVTPDSQKISEHREILAKGLDVTSQDEEAGLANYGFEKFAQRRFGAESINQLAALFCWGPEDYSFLVSRYPECSEKIHLVGSSRADLWHHKASSVATTPQRFEFGNYLLVSSSFGMLEAPIAQFFASEFSSGYYSRDLTMMKERFEYFSDTFTLAFAFYEAVVKLCDLFPNLQIVFRPHPRESLALWSLFFGGLQNVHVTREGSSSDWVHHASALLHNGCTTAFEAQMAGKPVISFEPFAREDGSLANEIGTRTRTLEELEEAIQTAVYGTQKTRPNVAHKADSLVSSKIFTKETELASERIVSVWESVAKDSPEAGFPRLRFWFLTGPRRTIDLGRSLLGRESGTGANQKFPPQNFDEVREKVRKIEAFLGVRSKATVLRMHNRCFVIVPSRRANLRE